MTSKAALVTIRKMLPSDVAAVDQLAVEADFDIGAQNLQIMYDWVPDSWFVAVNSKQEIVAFVGGNPITNDVGYSYIIMVREDYRGLGISSRFLKSDIHAVMACPKLLGSASSHSIARYNLFNCWLDKKLAFFGNITRKPILEQPETWFSVTQLTADLFGKLCNYDKSLIHLDRIEFLRRWCMDSYAKSVVAQNSHGGCIGYGVLRQKHPNSYLLTPLYADSEIVAKHIFDRLAEFLKIGEELWMPFLAKQRAVFEKCTALGLKLLPDDVDVRYCTTEAKQFVEQLDTSKVYSMIEFWPI